MLLDMAVEFAEAAGTIGEFSAGDHFIGPRFFLDLFLDEPMEENLGGVILRLHGGFVGFVDAGSVGEFHALRMFGHLHEILELTLRCGERLQNGENATVEQMLDEFLCVFALFASLLVEETGKAFQILVVAPERERKVSVGSTQFVVELALEFAEDGRWDGRHSGVV